MLLAVALANHYGEDGALAVYPYSWMVYLLPYAVLAVPSRSAHYPGWPGTPSAVTGGLSPPPPQLRPAPCSWRPCRVPLCSQAPRGRWLGCSSVRCRAARRRSGWPTPSWPSPRGCSGLPSSPPDRALLSHRARARGDAATVTGWLTVMVADLRRHPAVDRMGRRARRSAQPRHARRGRLLLLSLRRAEGAAVLRGVVPSAGLPWSRCSRRCRVRRARWFGRFTRRWSATARRSWRRRSTGVFTGLTACSPGETCAGAAHLLRRGRHPVKVALVLGTSTGGVGQHVSSLVGRLTRARRRGHVLGPSDADAGVLRLLRIRRRVPSGGVVGRARPGSVTSKAIRRLRRLSAAYDDSCTRHGLRAGRSSGLRSESAARAVPLVATWHNAILGTGARRRVLGPSSGSPPAGRRHPRRVVRPGRARPVAGRGRRPAGSGRRTSAGPARSATPQSCAPRSGAASARWCSRSGGWRRRRRTTSCLEPPRSGATATRSRSWLSPARAALDQLPP